MPMCLRTQKSSLCVVWAFNFSFYYLLAQRSVLLKKTNQAENEPVRTLNEWHRVEIRRNTKEKYRKKQIIFTQKAN